MSWKLSLSQLVVERLGIELHERQLRDDVERFVTSRAASVGASSPEAYVDLLREQSVTGAEFSALVRVITVAHSFFFRDLEQLSSALDALRQRARHAHKLHLWSACCSTGQEAWSMLMLAAENGIDLTLWGTDINRDVVGIARAGTYTAWAMRSVDDQRKERFFKREGANWRVRDSLRKRARFSVRNLMDGPPPGSPIGGFDVILCRNAFIYFTPEGRARAGRKLGSALQEHGWLFLGASETLRGLPDTGLAPEMRWGRVAWHRGSVPALLPTPPPPAKLPPARHAPANPPSAKRSRSQRQKRETTPPIRVAPAPASGDAIAALNRGHARLQAHEFDDALEAYSQAQALNPLLPEVHFCEGVVHRKGSALPQAVAAFRRALFLDPSFWPASFLLAGVYQRLENPARQRRHLNATLKALSSRPPGPLFRSGVTGVESLHLDPDKVRDACNRLLS